MRRESAAPARAPSRIDVLLPRPAALRTSGASVLLRPSPTVTTEGDGGDAMRALTEAFAARRAEQAAPGATPAAIRIEIARGRTAPEGFRLRVEEGSPPRVSIVASDGAGAFYGAKALAQLSLLTEAGWLIPALELDDAPRFSWRGVHVDVARHFFPAATLERLVTAMASLRLNTLHLHLTDDQGFRLPSPSHPEISEGGSSRVEADGSVTAGVYREEELAALSAHARRHHVTLVPEIDSPGHTRALLHARPELSCRGVRLPVPTTWGVFDDTLCPGNDDALALMGELLDETARLVPGPYVHLGGDEVPTTRWRECAKCRARAKREGLADVSALHGAWLRALAARALRSGRTPLVWDDAIEGDRGPVPSAIVVAWRGREHAEAAARAGHRVVMAPVKETYLDTKQHAADGFQAWDTVTWEAIGAFDPRAGASQALREKLLGAEVALWTEHVESEEELGRRLFPRVVAFADAMWSGPRASLDAQAKRVAQALSRPEIAAFASFVEPPSGVEPRGFLERATITPRLPLLESRSVIRLSTSGADPTTRTPPWGGGALTVRGTTEVRAATFRSDGSHSAVVRAALTKLALRDARPPPHRRAPGLQYALVEGSFDRAPTRIDEGGGAARGTAARVTLPEGAPRERYGMVMSGLFLATEEGVHRFALTSDDGAVLAIDGEVVADGDGTHPPRAAVGDVALRRGFHELTVRFFQGGAGAALSLQVTLPSGRSMEPGPSVLTHALP